MEKYFTKKNIINALFFGFILLLIFVPSTKALMIRGLMKVGLFSPSLESPKVEAAVETAPMDLSGIRFKDATGKVLDLGDLKGKVVFLNFWATWCPPCIAEMPAVNKLYEQFKDDKEVVFILVDADGDFAKSQKFMDKKDYKLPLYIADSSVPEAIFKGSLPTTVVFDKMGRVSYNEVGAANYASDKFVEFIKQLKASKK